MIHSMTGFGRGVVASAGRRFVAEIKSVNNRYCEVFVSAPKDLLELEHEIAQAVKAEFSRGKFDVHLKVEQERAAAPWLDEKNLVARWKALDAVRRKLGLETAVPLEAAIPFARASAPEGPDAKATAKCLLDAVRRAMAQLKLARAKEGKGLAKILRQRLEAIAASVQHIGQHVPSGQEERRKRFFWKLERILDEKNLDRRRVETEIALLIEKADVSEELERFALHVRRFAEMLRGKSPVGREMDFVLQEMNREINTVGSKSPDPHVSEEVIFVKAELEKIREQVQNLE